MNLNEMWDKSPESYQDLSQDNSRAKLKQLRSTRLTLQQIKQLRKLNDIRGYENKEKIDFIQKMYSPPAQPG